MPSLFHMPIETLKGIGKRRAELFRKLGIDSVGDLIRFYPRAYEDWSHPMTISQAAQSGSGCIRAAVEKSSKPVRIRGGMTILRIWVTDGTDYMKITFFNQPFLADKLTTGREFLFYGTLRATEPEYEMTAPLIADTGSAGIRPIYPQTAGLSSKQIEAAAAHALRLLPEVIRDPIPAQALEKYSLCGLREALFSVHFPESMEQAEKAKHRLAFEELLMLQLGIGKLRSSRRHIEARHIIKDYSDEFIRLLPFTLTSAQSRAIRECMNDMLTAPAPMNRLIQGDVGSGKTAVAAAVCYSAAKNGLQCAFMAPTEILAAQHFSSLSSLLSGSGICVELLTGSTKASQKRDILQRLQSGEIQLIIGTHALISDDVVFHDLGLVIADEQHRFGVAQRAALISKGNHPHIMVMSATPIPRTLALMIFGDLDLSVLDELPPGRQKVDTFLIDSSKRSRALGFLKKQTELGRQCYIVCPLVAQNDMTGLKSAEEYAEALKGTVLSDCRTGLLHGKMKARDKDEIMSAFAEGKLDILVSTTVIEVGVNVPNATIMLIENAERFGLSQLHQLRGRVGRGSDKSYCIMISDNQSDTTRQRLSVMCRTNNGFEIADEDLRLRGPGDFFGSRQHGLPELKAASISSMEMLNETQECARQILSEDPDLCLDKHRALASEINRLFARTGGA